MSLVVNDISPLCNQCGKVSRGPSRECGCAAAPAANGQADVALLTPVWNWRQIAAEQRLVDRGAVGRDLTVNVADPDGDVPAAVRARWAAM